MAQLTRVRQQELVALWKKLRELLWQWNPIGFPVPADEYESLIAPLVSRFKANLSTEEIVLFLEQTMKDEFGVTPPFERETEAFVKSAREMFDQHQVESEQSNMP